MASKPLQPYAVGTAFEVQDTPEFRRILNLRRRNWEEEARKNDLYLRMTRVFKMPLGTQELRPIQAGALADAHDLRGLLAPVRVGEGKTLLTFLLPTVVQNIKRPVLLVPAALIEKTWREFQILSRHWVSHPSFITRARFDEAVISYEILGRDSGKDKINALRPDMIIADEAHRLRNRQAACTKRVERYMIANPTTVFCGMSGTITKRSLQDYHHLLYWALRENMPLPRPDTESEKWAEVLDEKKTEAVGRRGPGVLLQLCTDEERARAKPQRTAPIGRTSQMPTVAFQEQLTAARKGYQRRLRDSPGVICSSDANLDCSLIIQRLRFDPGPVVTRHLKELRETWETPNGELLTLPTDIWRHARELACGFWYAWWDCKGFERCLSKILRNDWSTTAPDEVDTLLKIKSAWSGLDNTSRSVISSILNHGVLATEKDIAVVRVLERQTSDALGSLNGISASATAPRLLNTKPSSSSTTGPVISVEKSGGGQKNLDGGEAVSRLITATKQAKSEGYSARRVTERSELLGMILRVYPVLSSILRVAVQAALPPDYWKQARKTWHWNVRQILDPQGLYYGRYTGMHIDSPMQVGLAIADGRIVDPTIQQAYKAWVDVRNDYKINTVAEWVDDSTINLALRWLNENERGIVWTEHRAFGQRLSEMAGTGFCSTGGMDAEGRTIEEYDGKPVIASVQANHGGRNLQAWNRNLVITASPTGSLWEQLLGRTHRMGQQADTVYVDWLDACDEQAQGFQQLMADAQYIQDTTGFSQKLLYADHI
jgi:hypothetical protein